MERDELLAMPMPLEQARPLSERMGPLYAKVATHCRPWGRPELDQFSQMALQLSVGTMRHLEALFNGTGHPEFSAYPMTYMMSGVNKVAQAIDQLLNEVGEEMTEEELNYLQVHIAYNGEIKDTMKGSMA